MTSQAVTQSIESHILLAGGLRAPALALAAERSILDLYLTPTATVLDLWIEHLGALEHDSEGRTPIRVLYGEAGPPPGTEDQERSSHVSFEKERSGYRGPAGALKDACQPINPDASMLVADAGRYLNADVRQFAEAHAEKGADITVCCDDADQPLGLYLMKLRVLDLIPNAGFMDLKEQFLNKAIDAGFGVWVHRAQSGRSMSVRTRVNFLDAARAAAKLPPITPGQDPVLNGVAGRNEHAAMRVIAESATVAEGAFILDSVVMPSATVESGAVIARSIICPGARVEAGAQVVDAVVGPRGIRLDEFEAVGRRRMGR